MPWRLETSNRVLGCKGISSPVAQILSPQLIIHFLSCLQATHDISPTQLYEQEQQKSDSKREPENKVQKGLNAIKLLEVVY